jgi:glyoxylate/hydroxypyruvate reductase A
VKILCASTSLTEQSIWRDLLAAALPQAEVIAWQNDMPVQDADIAVVWKPPVALFERERKLRAVFNLGAGVDALLAIPGLPADLPIVRLEDAGMGVQMAEYVIHALVRASRRFDDYDVQQRAGQWRALPELDRRQWPVGVLGMGVLGAQVARAVAGLGYPVAAWSRSGRTAEAGIEMYAGSESLSAFLQRTRVLVNLLPLTHDTEGILCRATLSQLLPQAHLINIARGQHLVEEDLLPLIDEGRLSGATLDVFRQEPLPAGHPFWTHPRVTVTPHIAAISLQRETVEQISGKIRAFMRGEIITGIVARDRGY